MTEAVGILVYVMWKVYLGKTMASICACLQWDGSAVLVPKNVQVTSFVVVFIKDGHYVQTILISCSTRSWSQDSYSQFGAVFYVNLPPRTTSLQRTMDVSQCRMFCRSTTLRYACSN